MKRNLLLLGCAFLGLSSLTEARSWEKVVRCESVIYVDKQECYAGPNPVILNAKKLSDASCIEGVSYGVDGDNIWVTYGCRGDFLVSLNDNLTPPPTPYPRRVYDSASLRCESINKHYNECDLDLQAYGLRVEGVRVLQQLSDKDCKRGRNYGETSRGVWVDDGCRAYFRVDYSYIQ